MISLLDRITDLYYMHMSEWIGWQATVLLPWVGIIVSIGMIATGIRGLRETHRAHKQNQESGKRVSLSQPQSSRSDE